MENADIQTRRAPHENLRMQTCRTKFFAVARDIKADASHSLLAARHGLTLDEIYFIGCIWVVVLSEYTSKPSTSKSLNSLVDRAFKMISWGIPA